MSETCRIRRAWVPSEPVIQERRSQRSRDFRETLAEMWEAERLARRDALLREQVLLDQVMRLTEENRSIRATLQMKGE